MFFRPPVRFAPRAPSWPDVHAKFAMPRQPKARRQVEEAAAEADGPCAAGAVVHGAGVAVQCFLDCDLTDKAASFIARQSEGMRLQLRQSHGWIDGWLDAGSLGDARARYSPANKHSWPRVTPDRKYSFVDRHGRSLPDPDPAVPGPDPDPDPDAAPAPAPALPMPMPMPLTLTLTLTLALTLTLTLTGTAGRCPPRSCACG